LRQVAGGSRMLKQAYRWLDDRYLEISSEAAELRARLGGKNARDTGISPENIVWIFGAGRTGSSWLSSMMGELEGHTVWFEPWVGALFDPYHLRIEDHKGKHFILAPQYRKTWLRSIRAFVLDGAEARFPKAAKGDGNYLVIKEPGGSVGASLLMEALPTSRMVLLVRDPRDVVASWIDAHREGGWQLTGEGPEASAERGVRVAKSYLRHVGEAKQAYEAHEGRKVLVRYEELREDTLATMERIYSELEIPIDEEQLARAVEKHSWENIPEEEKGEGKFYRKATPGSWREDLTPEQIEMVEKITAPLLKEFYPA
jgi:sulfotransferase family protein